MDAVFDVRGVFQASHQAMSMDELPEILWPQKGFLGLKDYEKAFCVDPAADIYDMRDIDRAHGCVIVVRPDQYIAEVLPLNAREQLEQYFAGLLTLR